MYQHIKQYNQCKKYKFILENNGHLSLFSAYIAPSLMALTEGRLLPAGACPITTRKSTTSQSRFPPKRHFF